MEEMLKLLRDTSPILLLLAILAYFAKVFIEKRLEGFAGRVEEVAKTSLDVKKGLRDAERDELLALRVAIEKWEYFLETAASDFAMADPSKAQVSALYERDKELFLDVRIAVVKVSTYLRNRELERQLMSAILEIRKVYYPVLDQAILKLIDLQGQLQPIERKLREFEQSGMRDMTNAPTEQDWKGSLTLRGLMTTEVARFSEAFLSQYRGIAERMDTLKESINEYIYRPIREAAIDKD